MVEREETSPQERVNRLAAEDYVEFSSGGNFSVSVEHLARSATIANVFDVARRLSAATSASTPSVGNSESDTE